jgi:hypothetical protein
MTKKRKTVKFPRFGSDAMSVFTCLLIEGTAFIDLSGRKTLRALSAFKFTPPPTNSAIPIKTTAKSMKFQPSLR